MKLSAVAAGTAITGVALFGAAQLGGLHPAQVFGPSNRDVALAAAPTFDQSLEALLQLFGITSTTTVSDLVGSTVTVGDVLNAEGLDATSPLSTVLAALNPDGTTLDGATGGLLTDTVGSLLGGVGVGGTPVTDLTFDALAGDLLGSDPTATSLYDVLEPIGLGPYAGLIDICDGTSVLGICTGTQITDTSDVSQLLGYLTGGLNPSTATVGDWLTNTDLPNTTTPIGDAEVGQLLGLTTAQLTEPWNTFLDGIQVNGFLSATPELLGDVQLGSLLTDLLPLGSSAVSDSTTVADFLDTLGIGTQTIYDVLGL